MISSHLRRLLDEYIHGTYLAVMSDAIDFIFAQKKRRGRVELVVLNSTEGDGLHILPEKGIP